MLAITRKLDNHTLQTRILDRVQLYIPSHWGMQHTFETDLISPKCDKRGDRKMPPETLEQMHKIMA